MTHKESNGIKEFLTKDDERFRLVKLGFFSSIDEELKHICSDAAYEPEDNETFSQWKSRILEKFYQEKNFSDFFNKNYKNEFLEKGIKSFLNIRLREIFEISPRSEIDKYLAASDDTVSYALSPHLFENIIGENFNPKMNVHSTGDLYTVCKEIISGTFPAQEPYILDRLQNNDNYYWNKVYTRLRPLASGFSYQISGTQGLENVSDIWCDTCCTINMAVVEKKIQQPFSAKDIISYAVGIIKNKNKELLRSRKKMPKVDIDSVTYKLTSENDENYFNQPETLPSNFPSQKELIPSYLDIKDEQAVRNYMVLVLYNEAHPLHDALIKGNEDKVKLLFEHYIDDLSYEEIVTKHFGEVSESDMIRYAAKIRQDVKRVKERLIKRFDALLKTVSDER